MVVWMVVWMAVMMAVRKAAPMVVAKAEMMAD